MIYLCLPLDKIVGKFVEYDCRFVCLLVDMSSKFCVLSNLLPLCLVPMAPQIFMLLKVNVENLCLGKIVFAFWYRHVKDLGQWTAKLTLLSSLKMKMVKYVLKAGNSAEGSFQTGSCVKKS